MLSLLKLIKHKSKRIHRKLIYHTNFFLFTHQFDLA